MSAALYKGRVMHLRLQPVRHQFRYRVFSLYLDLDRIGETLKPLLLLSHNRFSLMSFYDADHGARDGSDLRDWVDLEHSKRGLARPHRVTVLAFPRILGYVFNPLTIYYCFDDVGALKSILYEVKNTFGDQVAYLIPCETGAAVQTHTKQMYVSPFIELDQTYRFELNPPLDRLSLRIRQSGADGEVLISALNADRVALSDRALLGLFLSHPLMTLKVMAGIHFEALRLFIKGVRFRRYSKSQIFSKDHGSL